MPRAHSPASGRRRPRIRVLAECLTLGAILCGFLWGLRAEIARAEPDETVRPKVPTGDAEYNPDVGRFRILPKSGPQATFTPEQQEQFEQLRSIGYLGGVTESAQSGVTVYDPDRAWDGFNLYTSGHDATAYLMDMAGEILHVWSLPAEEVWPGSDALKRRGSHWWRRARLLENGDLLALFEGVGILRIDKDSNLLWANENGAHHDLAVLPDGDTLVLTREPRLIPEIHETDLTLEDFLSRLGPDGREKERHSVYEALANSPYAKHIGTGWKQTGDVFHTNTLHVLSGSIADRVPEFCRGCVLTSLNSVGLIGVWNLEEDRFTWARKYEPGGQHDPEILENGHLLFFDNYRNGRNSVVVEVDPATDAIVWEFRGTEERPFHSKTCGTQERLPNGNTLITESDGGRAIEVTADGEIVWEFYNPERAGDEGEFIATIGEMERIPPESVESWLP